MKIKYRILTIVVLMVFCVPSLTYAAWWKPSTWFKKTVPTPVVQMKSGGSASSTPKTITASPAPKTQTSPVKKEAIIAKPKTDQSAEIEKLKKEVEELKNKQTDSQAPTSVLPITPTGILCNGVYWSKCSAEQDFVCPSSGNAYCKSRQQSQGVPVAEENFSNVVTEILSSQTGLLQNVIDYLEKSEIIYSDVKQIWSNELAKTNMYLETYPNDQELLKYAQVYKLLIQVTDLSREQLHQFKNLANKFHEDLTGNIVNLRGKKVSRSEMQTWFNSLQSIDKAINGTITDINELNAKFSADQYKFASSINAKQQEYIRKNQQITQSQAEVNKMMLEINTSVIRAQNLFNTSHPTYCNATNLGLGSVSVVCY